MGEKTAWTSISRWQAGLSKCGWIDPVPQILDRCPGPLVPMVPPTKSEAWAPP